MWNSTKLSHGRRDSSAATISSSPPAGLKQPSTTQTLNKGNNNKKPVNITRSTSVSVGSHNRKPQGSSNLLHFSTRTGSTMSINRLTGSTPSPGQNHSFTLPRGYGTTKPKETKPSIASSKDDSVMMNKPYLKAGPKRSAPLPPPRGSQSTIVPRRRAPPPPPLGQIQQPSATAIDVTHVTNTGQSPLSGHHQASSRVKGPSLTRQEVMPTDTTDGGHIVDDEDADLLYELPSKSLSKMNSKLKMVGIPSPPTHILGGNDTPPPIPNSPRPSMTSLTQINTTVIEETESIYEITNSADESNKPPPPLPPRTLSATKLSTVTASSEVPPTLPPLRSSPKPTPSHQTPPPLPPISKPPSFKPPPTPIESSTAIKQDSMPPEVLPLPNDEEADGDYMEMSLINSKQVQEEDEYILMGEATKTRDLYLAKTLSPKKTTESIIMETQPEQEEHYMEMNVNTSNDGEDGNYMEMSSFLPPASDSGYVQMIPSNWDSNEQQLVTTDEVIREGSTPPPPPVPPKPKIPVPAKKPSKAALVAEKHLRSVPKQRMSAPHLPPPPPRLLAEQTTTGIKTGTTHVPVEDQQQDLYEPISQLQTEELYF